MTRQLMRILHAMIAVLLTSGWLYFGSISLNFGGFFLPPPGSFFCPSTGFWQNAESWETDHPREITLADLLDTAEVYYNDRRVPYVYADHAVDLVKVQGYLHARDRLWQMDVNTRAAAGRISEILGKRALPFDRKQRNYGLLRGARQILREISDDAETMRFLNAYAEGVNTYIDQLQPADYPLEFKLLNYAPQPWKPLHSVLFMKNMQQTLASKQQDLKHTNALALIGRDSFQRLFPDWFPRQQPIISTKRKWNFQAIEADTSVPEASIELRRGNAPPPVDSREGSNNWALSGIKTESGAPILCNDPHLGLTLPSIWYEMQMSTPNNTVYGVSFPGAPMIIIGFNRHIAWGVTNGSHDVLDWYDIDWVNRAKGTYKIGDSTYRADAVRDTISVRNRDPVILRSWSTRHGTVWNEPGHPLDGASMHWLANQPLGGNLFKSFLLINRAENYSEFKEALKHYDCPIQNFAFASKTDTIALHTQGALPVKPRGFGKFILDGRSPKTFSRQFIPPDQLPHEVNPERGYVFSANQHSTTPDYPYSYHGAFADYRGRYLKNTLDTLSSAGMEEMKALQNTDQSLHGLEGIEILKEYRNNSAATADQRDTLNQLLEWDGTFRADGWKPTFFALWWNEFKRMTWDEFRRNNTPLEAPEDWMLRKLALDQPAHEFFDNKNTSQKEDAAAVVRTAFQNTFNRWDSLYSPAGEPIPWSLYNNAHIDHLAGLPGFSTERLDIGGYRYALNAQTATKGPSWRMIVQMSDTIEAYGVYPGGQSGNPGSRYYENQVEQWKNGEYYRIDFAPKRKELKNKGYLKQRVRPQE